MKRLFPLCLLLAATLIVSCKATDPVVTVPDVTLAPPPVGQGIQIEIMPFDVPSNTEVQGNFYLIIPSDVPFNVGRIEIAMNEGTHHMNLYKTSKHLAPDTGFVLRPVIMRDINGKVDTQKVIYQAQFNAAIVQNGGDMMVEAQVPYLNWEFPKLTEGPNAGRQTCVQFAAHDTIIIENHYVNIPSVSQATPNGRGKVIINLWKSTEAQPVLGAMMFAKKNHLTVETGEHTYFKDCKWGGAQGIYGDSTLYLLGMTGHFHSRGKSFWVEKRQSILDLSGNVIGDSLIANIYQSSTWSEPPFTVYNTPIKIDLHKGEFLRYYASYVNTTGNPIPFGAHVKDQEHMNLFVWFAPGQNKGATFYDNDL